MNYYISDMHLFCANQTGEGKLNHDNRPFATMDEMHTYILEHWNAKITNGDTVYILGDVSMRGRCDPLIALVAQLKGKKILIRGNHDDLSDLRYKQLFTEIADYKMITDSFGGKNYKLVLCHFPILAWDGQHKGVIHLYGHTHNSIEETFFQQCLFEFNTNKKLAIEGGKRIRAFNVGAMIPYMGYEPRTLKEILASHGELEDKTEKV